MTDADRRSATLFDRTLAGMRGVVRGLFPGDAWQPGPDLPGSDADTLRGRLADCLAARGGEVSARARAAGLGQVYLQLDDTGRRRFLAILAGEFGCDRAAVDAAIAAVTAAPAAARPAAEEALREALTAPRVRLLRQFNALSGGVKFLVDLRTDLLRFRDDEPALADLESDLKKLLGAWFDAGFLELRRMDWHTPAALLEKLIDYEAVHEIRDWQDLKNRLDSDRRCYAFFHPNMPDEPCIFLEAALVTGLAGDIQTLLDTDQPVADPRAADTAIFYSISNAQRGLAGIGFGDFLIKRVVENLRAELPNLKTFATLSPIPGFRRWLADNPDAAVGDCLARDQWWRAPESADAARNPVMRAAARYLTADRGDGRVRDPVAHFHLSNGARVERLNWLADVSESGLAQSAGLMVNYLYRLDRIEANHESYTGAGRVAASSPIRALARS